MQPSNDTFVIPSRRFAPELPMARVAAQEPANNPEAAAVARAKIAALDMPTEGFTVNAIPAAAPQDLITDRDRLAKSQPFSAQRARRTIPSPLRPALTAIGIFTLILLTFKAPVIFSELGYNGAKTPAPAVTTADNSAAVSADPTISIPKINVNAPVVYEPSVAEADVQRALQSGVDHYGNTPAPGQGGNSVIFGHSSNDWWEPGNYKFVFVLLDKLVPGDRFTVDYQSKRYTYEVTGSRVVEPTDLSVLTQTTEPTMTLITCTPPGTSWKRLVVTAKQIDPSPTATSVASTNSQNPTANTLPGSAPGFFTQAGQAVSGIYHGFLSLFGADQGSQSTQSQPSELPTAK